MFVMLVFTKKKSRNLIFECAFPLAVPVVKGFYQVMQMVPL